MTADLAGARNVGVIAHSAAAAAAMTARLRCPRATTWKGMRLTAVDVRRYDNIFETLPAHVDDDELRPEYREFCEFRDFLRLWPTFVQMSAAED